LAAQLGSGLRQAVGILLDGVGPGASVGFFAWFIRRGRNWDALPNPPPPFGFPRDGRPRAVAWQRTAAHNHAADGGQADGPRPAARARLLLPPYVPRLASNALDCQHPDCCGVGPTVRGVGGSAQPGEPGRTLGRKRLERVRTGDFIISRPAGSRTSPLRPGNGPRPRPCSPSGDSVRWSLVTQRGEQAAVGFRRAPSVPNPPYSSSPKGETYDENNTFEAKGLRSCRQATRRSSLRGNGRSLGVAGEVRERPICTERAPRGTQGRSPLPRRSAVHGQRQPSRRADRAPGRCRAGEGLARR
jgi:hypothetical protein